jgi:hypothetical protein
MSFLKKLFGLGESAPREAPPPPTQEHQGFTIAATPFESEGRWQLAGAISREVDGVMKEHKFIRADSFMSKEEAVEMSFFKGRQMIDQLGDRIWSY